MHIAADVPIAHAEQTATPVRFDPRAQMAICLPRAVQPFLTWLTAKPAPGEIANPRSPLYYVFLALALTLGGCLLSGAAMLHLATPFAAAAALFVGLTLTTSGLGLFQVGIFHHCAHNSVFATRNLNEIVGRAISALLLFKYFDSYKREHMRHHSPKILFTPDDEFRDFMIHICNLPSGISRERLWRRLTLLLISPAFHGSFLLRRIKGSLTSENAAHNWAGGLFWGGLLISALLMHLLLTVAVAVVLPVTVLLQVATVFRILCEHRVPEARIIQGRDRNLVCQATAGVMAGAALPEPADSRLRTLLGWSLWWANMLTVQLFIRITVLVGDAPCHDFHHRRPGDSWTNYIHGRQADIDAGCPGFPANYAESWGLFQAIDENFAALSRAPESLFPAQEPARLIPQVPVRRIAARAAQRVKMLSRLPAVFIATTASRATEMQTRMEGEDIEWRRELAPLEA